MSKEQIKLGLITNDEIKLFESYNNSNNILLRITDELLNIDTKINLDNSIITNNIVYSTDLYYYTSFYLLYDKNENIQQNNKAQPLSLGNDTIYGNCVIIKSDYENNNLSITKEEIEYILNLKEKNIGYLLTTDNKIIQKKFTNLNIKEYGFNEPVLIKFVLFGYLIKIYLDCKLDENNNKLNKIATSIHKHFKINGNVFICIVKLEQNKIVEYLNLDSDDIILLLILLIENDINDPSKFINKNKPFLYLLYENYNEKTNKIFGKMNKKMIINVSENINYLIFDSFIYSLKLDKELIEGLVLNEHINIDKVKNKTDK